MVEPRPQDRTPPKEQAFDGLPIQVRRPRFGSRLSQTTNTLQSPQGLGFPDAHIRIRTEDPQALMPDPLPTEIYVQCECAALSRQSADTHLCTYMMSQFG